jgi:hypothetical protein
VKTIVIAAQGTASELIFQCHSMDGNVHGFISEQCLVLYKKGGPKQLAQENNYQSREIKHHYEQ